MFGRWNREIFKQTKFENMFSSEPTELIMKRPAGRRKIIIDENKDFTKELNITERINKWINLIKSNCT